MGHVSAVQYTDVNGNPVTGVLRPTSGSTKIVSVGGTSTPFTGKTIIRIVTTQNSYIAIKSSGTASASDTYIPANQPEYFKTNPNDYVCLAGAGTAYVDTMQ